MKRFIAALLALAMVFVFVSCEEKPEPPKEYTLTFNANGHGTAPEVQKVLEGQKATRPEDPAAVGYTFGGWFKEETCTNAWDFAAETVNADITLYAKWTLSTYTVTFDMKGHGTAVAAQEVSHGSKATLPTPAPSEIGYGFGGWFKDAECTVAWDFDADTVTSNATIYAKWKEKNFTVTFDKNGHGTAPAAITVQEGQKVTAPSDLSAVGYTFGGWFKDAECTTAWDFATDIVSADTTLYAKWTLNTYTFSFVMNDHGTEVPAQTIAHGSKATRPSDPADEDYGFWDWYTNEACTTKFNFNTVIMKDTTVYAKWTEKKTITYTTEFGTLSKDSDRVGLGLRITEPTAPSYSGYAFDGWYTADDKLWNFTQDTVQGDMTLTAKWTLICSAVFNANGHGTAPASQTNLRSGAYVGKPNDPVETGYDFGGWYTDEACEGKKWDFASDTITTNPLNLYAKWTPKTFNITLVGNVSGSTNGSGVATYAEGRLTVTNPVQLTEGRIEGYYLDSSYNTMVAYSDGTLMANLIGYTDGEGKWIRFEPTTLYARWIFSVAFVDPNGYYDAAPEPVPETITVYQGGRILSPAFPSTDPGAGYSYVWMPVDGDDAFDFDRINTPLTLSLEKSYNGNDYQVIVRNNKYAVTGYSGAGGDIVVPAIIKNKRIYSVYNLLWTGTGNRTVTSVTFSEGIKSLEYQPIADGRTIVRVVIPSTVEFICGSFFYCTEKVSEVVISPQNTNYKVVGNAIYSYDMTNLVAVFPTADTYVFPESVTKISRGAFTYCKSLDSVTIPESVRDFETDIFKGSSVTSVTLPSGITTIPNGFLMYCNKVTSFDIPDSVTTIGGDAFRSCKFTSIDIPSSVITIGGSAFMYTAVESFTFPQGVTVVSQSVLNGCSELTEVSIPNGVTRIEQYAFYECIKLPRITIPETVTAIGQCAFKRCSSLEEITLEYAGGVIPYTTDLLTGTHANLVIRVPAALVEEYKAAEGWSDFASKIEGIPL